VKVKSRPNFIPLGVKLKDSVLNKTPTSISHPVWFSQHTFPWWSLAIIKQTIFLVKYIGIVKEMSLSSVVPEARLDGSNP